MTATKLEVWEWLMDNGAVSDAEEIANGIGADEEVVQACLRSLSNTGHVSLGLKGGWEPNPTDELYPLPSPFGAGGGPVSGEKPEDKLPERYL